jgi:DNA repair photolyase
MERFIMTEKRFETIIAKQMLNRVKAERMPFDWSLNPYRGCAHGCSFCYARAFQSFIGKDAQDEFQHHIFIKENAAEALESQLAAFARRNGVRPEQVGSLHGPIAIGTATDPYQPIEGKTRITRACLEVLAKYNVETSVTTRSPLILRDVDVLHRMNVTSLNISINTLDPELTRRLEPATPFPRQRLETISALTDEGLPAGVFIAPILPYLTDAEAALDALFAAAKSHGAAYAMTSLLRLSPDVKAWYFHTLEQHFPDLIPGYAQLYEKAYADRSYTEMMHRRIEAISQRHALPGRVPGPTSVQPQPTPPPQTSTQAEAVQLAFPF